MVRTNGGRDKGERESGVAEEGASDILGGRLMSCDVARVSYVSVCIGCIRLISVVSMASVLNRADALRARSFLEVRSRGARERGQEESSRVQEFGLKDGREKARV